MFRPLSSMIALSLAVGFATCAQASPASIGGAMGQIRLTASSEAPTRQYVFAPMAAVRFCITYPRECDGSPETRIALDLASVVALDRVNRSVNARITPRPDVPGDDRWELYKTEGDCDDYAAQKRHELILLGFPASALLLAAGTIATGEAHLVLMVLTDRGDYVLDNLTNQIRPWNRTGIRWMARQSPENPRVWQALGGSRTRVNALQMSSTRVALDPPVHGALVQGPTRSL
jgi:predicted transglutaminase-like cysteine proteinase